MHSTILLAAAVRRWDRYSTHAIAARDVALAPARSVTPERLHVLTVYHHEPFPSGTSGLSEDAIARLRAQHERDRQHTDELLAEKLAEDVAPLKDLQPRRSRRRRGPGACAR